MGNPLFSVTKASEDMGDTSQRIGIYGIYQTIVGMLYGKYCLKICMYIHIYAYIKDIYIYIRQTKTVLLVGPKWLIPPIAVYEEHDEIYHKLLLNRKMMRYTISKSKDKHQFLVFHKGLVSTGNIKDYPWLRKCVGILGLLGF